MQLYIRLGKRGGLTIRQLGYPTKNALKGWYGECEQRLELYAGYLRQPKYMKAQKDQAFTVRSSPRRCTRAWVWTWR